SGAHRTDRQKTTLAQNTTAWTCGVQRNPAEVTATDVRNAIVLSQPFINERVVRIEQIDNAAILANDAFEEHFGFPPEPLPKIVIEVLRGSFDFGKLAQPEPLPCKVRDQRLRLGIGQHAPHLLLEDLWIAQPSLRCEIQKFVIWHAAPKEERQSRRQLQITNSIDSSVRYSGWFFFRAIQERRGYEYSRQCLLKTGLKIGILSTLLIKVHQRGHLGIHDRTPERASRKRRQDLARARNFFRGR